MDERTSALLLLFRHNTWATLRLIDYCRGLDDNQFTLSIPGTYGSILDTLRHFIRGEEDYFSVLTGEHLPDTLPERLDETVTLDNLAARIRRLGPRWEALAADQDIQERTAKFPDGIAWPGAVLMAQAIQHANDHRTHILSILGAHGLEVPRLDVWAHAFATGLQR